MGKVLQFPTKEVKIEALMEALDRTIDELDESYEELDILHHQMHELEKECNQKEYIFDYNLAHYAESVGVENVPIRFFGYTTRHRLHVDFDNDIYQLELFDGEWEDED